MDWEFDNNNPENFCNIFVDGVSTKFYYLDYSRRMQSRMKPDYKIMALLANQRYFVVRNKHFRKSVVLHRETTENKTLYQYPVQAGFIQKQKYDVVNQNKKKKSIYIFRRYYSLVIKYSHPESDLTDIHARIAELRAAIPEIFVQINEINWKIKQIAFHSFNENDLPFIKLHFPEANPLNLA